jgi:hypothetical protein
MQSQFVQPGNSAIADDGHVILVTTDRDQNGIQVARLRKQFIGSLPDPAMTKGNARHSPPSMRMPARIDRLFE